MHIGRNSLHKKTLHNLRPSIANKEFSFRKKIGGVLCNIDDIVSLLAKDYGLIPETIYTSKKRSLLPKKIAIYLAKRFTDLTNREIGESFKITYSAVSKAAGDIERLNDSDANVRKKIKQLISHFKG